jgi:capsid protein
MDGSEWVDPLKDAESIKLLYGLGQITYQEICSMSGKDYKSTFKQLVKERDMFEDHGMQHLMPNAQIDTSARREELVKEDVDKKNGVEE